VFQHVVMKIQGIFRRFHVCARLRVLVSVARVRKLVALAFITQSDRIPRIALTLASSPDFWRSYGRSGGFGRTLSRLGHEMGLSVIRMLKPWLCASSLGHGEVDTGWTRPTRLAIGRDRFG
jgi:hypothetical protein